MAWNIEAPKVATGMKTKETLWTSQYLNSLDRWIKDFELVDYKLTSEYILDDYKILYRFEGSGPAHNVIISSR